MSFGHRKGWGTSRPQFLTYGFCHFMLGDTGKVLSFSGLQLPQLENKGDNTYQAGLLGGLYKKRGQSHWQVLGYQ